MLVFSQKRNFNRKWPDWPYSNVLLEGFHGQNFFVEKDFRITSQKIWKMQFFGRKWSEMIFLGALLENFGSKVVSFEIIIWFLVEIIIFIGKSYFEVALQISKVWMRQRQTVWSCISRFKIKGTIRIPDWHTEKLPRN